MVSAFSGSLLMVLGCWGSLASVARAQCLSLDQMVSVGAAPTALAHPQDFLQLSDAQFFLRQQAEDSKTRFVTEQFEGLEKSGHGEEV